MAAPESAASIWLSAIRPRTLPAAVAPVLVGTALAWHEDRFVPPAAMLCLAFALLVQIGTNLANDYFDFRNGADPSDRVGPRRAVASGLVAPEVMARAALAVFGASFLVGLGLLPWGGPWILVAGISSIACGIAYTGGPWPLGYLGLGDLLVFLFFGLVAVAMTYGVQAGTVSINALLIAVPIGLLAANILVVNNYRDMETDARAGKRTLVVRFGRRFARFQFGGSHVAALLVPIALLFRNFGPAILLPGLLLPLAWQQCRRLARASGRSELIPLLGDSAKYLAAYALLLATGLALGG